MKIENSKAKLLLHSCCAPCLTSVYEQLESDWEITSFWFNPNIEPESEHAQRLNTIKHFCQIKNIPLVNFGLAYNRANQQFELNSKRLELEPEGGRRCENCIRYRLEETAKYAKSHDFDIFATTLSVSPHKDADMINRIGKMVADEYGINYLTADFKKHDGYKRSIKLSKKYDLYRQSYCGCRYSASR